MPLNYLIHEIYATFYGVLGIKCLETIYSGKISRALATSCLQASNGAETPKTLTREQIEERLEALIRSRGEDGLNELRCRARSIAGELGMQKEFTRLNTLISALMATRPSKLLSSTVAKARALGEPFDPDRIDLFEKLYEALACQYFPFYHYKNESTRSYQKLCLL